MSEHAEFDLVAIGGGFAGLVAALRGAELGLRTAVLEQGVDERYLCSSRWAGGIFHVSYHDVKLAPGGLVAAIGQLREEDRLVLAYRYFLDLSESEMADTLGIARGTVKSRLSRALGRLRGEYARA